jgi:hypothetical protein
MEDIMKTIKLSVLIILSIVLSSCIPGMAFEIVNNTNETIKIEYTINDNILGDDMLKTNKFILKSGEVLYPIFSSTLFFNQGITKEQLNEISIFLSIFENITITLSENNSLKFYKNDLINREIKHRKEMSSNIYSIEIDYTILME